MSEKFKPYDPKSQTLHDLLKASFWEHLSEGQDWKKEIDNALKTSSVLQIEKDNFRLQGELNVAMTVVAEQEVKIKSLEMILREYREYRNNVNRKLGEVLQLRVEDRGYY